MAVALYCNMDSRKVRVHKQPGQADIWPCMPCNKTKIAAFAGKQMRGFYFCDKVRNGLFRCLPEKITLVLL